MFFRPAAKSTISVPTDPVETRGRYSRHEKTFRPEFWAVQFDFHGRPEYFLVGSRLTNSGQPYATGETIEMDVPVSVVPGPARLDMAKQLGTKLDEYVTEQKAKILLVVKGES